MSMLEELKELGVNIDEGSNRIMGNSSLYERMLGTFAKMIRENRLQPDFDDHNYADVIEQAHAVKGTSGNLSITPVYEAYTKIVDLLRSNQPAEARKVLTDVLPIQDEIIACIEKYI